MPRILKLRAGSQPQPTLCARADIHELWGDRRLLLWELGRECIWLPSPARHRSARPPAVSRSDFCGCNKMPSWWCVMKKRGFSNSQSGDFRAWCQRLEWGLAASEHSKAAWWEPRDWEKAPGRRGGQKDSRAGSWLPSHLSCGN